MVDYLERYHRLANKNVDGRMDLARWCGLRGMEQQQADLLGEVLKIQPDHPTAYGELLEVDAKRARPVDKAWVEKLSNLLGGGFRLQHSAHFTLLTDCDEKIASLQAEALEDAYASFYREVPALGLRPMPPPGRLVCILFEKLDDCRDFLSRFENVTTTWGAGYYSWRTNRVAFYYDRDNPAFKEVRQSLANLERSVADLRGEMDRLPADANVERTVIRDRIKRLDTQRADMEKRLTEASRLATLAKTRHEAAHQLLFNSGLMFRGRDYPFWLSEGLAVNFELCDPQGHTGPKHANQYRLRSYRFAREGGRLLKLDDLLTSRPQEGADAERVAEQYAQAWGLVHFLWNKRPEQLAGFMRQVQSESPRDWMGLFQKHFGDDMAAMEGELRHYLDSL